MSQISMIALDLDNTFLRSDKSVSAANEAAVRRAKAQGICPVIASGRPFGSLPKSVLAIDAIRYAVTSNGAAVYDLHENKRIFYTPLGRENVLRILELFPDFMCFEVFIHGEAFAWDAFVADPVSHGATERGAAYIQKTRKPVANIRAFITEHADEVDALDLVSLETDNHIEYRTLIMRECPGVYATSSVRGLTEISGTVGGKCHGLRQLCAHLGVEPAHIMAFGDESNDIDMLSFAGIGVAMGNASDQVKAAADLTAPGADEDGVAHMINAYLEGRI